MLINKNAILIIIFEVVVLKLKIIFLIKKIFTAFPQKVYILLRVSTIIMLLILPLYLIFC